MYKLIYILTQEKNDAFLGAYATKEEAQNAATKFCVATRILSWNIIFPLDFRGLDEALQPQAALTRSLALEDLQKLGKSSSCSA